MKKKTVSFLISGRGSNFSAVAEKIIAGKIKAKPGIVISNKENAAGLEKAREYGMKAFFVDPKKFPLREDHEKEIIRLLDEYNTDLVVAAGYMRILSSHFVSAFKNRIINIHPALLPSFPGVNGQKQALDYGVRFTGCTSHFIDEGTDTGPIILQSVIAIEQDDTEASLSQRILKEEHYILPESVKLFCEDRLEVRGRRVYIK